MILYDNVKLKTEIEELSQKGIHKNYIGLVVKTEGDIFTVCFYNPHNFGESMLANVNKAVLSFVARANENIVEELKQHFTDAKPDTNKCLTECDVREYDKIELLVEKPEYADNGVHKGAFGCVLYPYAIEGKWGILFYNVGDNKDEEIEINVSRKDFKIID